MASIQDYVEGEKHPDFYFCNFIDVIAGHVICSFPSALIESSVLREKLETLKGGECLNIEGVSYPEVQAFLEVADARLVSGDRDFTFRQWVYALSVAEHLQLDHIRSYVAKSIEDGLTRLDPFECIEVADKRRSQEWLLQPFRRICQRVEPLSSSEMFRLGFDRASAVARARENLMKAMHPTKWFSSVYGGSAISSSAQTALTKYALQVVKAEPLLCQLGPEQVLGMGAPTGHTQIHSSNLSSSNLIIMKLRDCLYRLPLHYFGSQSLIHKLVASRVGQGPVSLPDDLDTSDWEAFLKIITARPYDQPEPSFAFAEWMGGLRVAKKLDQDCALVYIFGQIQKAYPKQNPVDLLEAARLADASHSPWLQDRYAILSQRSTAISSEEMRRMGEDAAAEVCKMREQAAYQRGKTDGEASSLDPKPSYPAKSRDLDETPPDSPARPVYLKASYPAKTRDLDETRPDSPATPMGLRASYPAKSRGPDKTPPDSPARSVYLNASYPVKPRDLDETRPDSPPTPMGLRASYPAKSRGPDKTPPDSPARPVYLNASYSAKTRDLDETPPDSPATPMGLKASYPAKSRGPDKTPPDSPAMPVYLNASYSVKPRDLDETRPDSPPTPMGLKHSYPARADETPRVKRNYPGRSPQAYRR